MTIVLRYDDDLTPRVIKILIFQKYHDWDSLKPYDVRELSRKIKFFFLNLFFSQEENLPVRIF